MNFARFDKRARYGWFRRLNKSGTPQLIRVDNGRDFVPKVLDRWAYGRRVTLDFSRPGKPTDNAFIETFNGRLRDECLVYALVLVGRGRQGQDRGLEAGL